MKGSISLDKGARVASARKVDADDVGARHDR